MNTGRWSCPRCGSNNFDTVTQCWKCNSSKTGGVSPPAYSAPPAVQAPSPMATQERALPAPPFPVNMGVLSGGDPAVAKRAAILLALTVPYFGLPIGWAFMMVEDYRKQAIGRFCVAWSCAGLVIHLVLGFIALQSSVAIALKMLTPMLPQSQNGRNLDTQGGDPASRLLRETNP